MADLNAKIIPLRTEVASRVPTGAQVDVGEIAVNLTDKKIYSKRTDGTVVQLGGGGLLNDIEDVNTAGAVTGNALIYDGANWVPGAGGGGGSSGGQADVFLVASSLEEVGLYNATSATYALPSSAVAQEGDLMLLFVGLRASERSADFTTPISTPAGWTKLADGTFTSNQGTTNETSHALFYRRYVAGDTSVTVTNATAVSTDDWFGRVDTYRNAVITSATIVDTNAGGGSLAASGYTSPNFIVPPGGALAAMAYNVYSWTTGTTYYIVEGNGALGVTDIGPEGAVQKRVHSWFATGSGTYLAKLGQSATTGSALTDGFHVAHISLSPAPVDSLIEELGDVAFDVPDDEGITGTWVVDWSNSNVLAGQGTGAGSMGSSQPAGFVSSGGLYITGISAEGHDFSDIFDGIVRGDRDPRLTITRSSGTGPQTWSIKKSIRISPTSPGYFSEGSTQQAKLFYFELNGGFAGTGPDGQTNVSSGGASVTVTITRPHPGTEAEAGDVLTYQEDGTWGATPILLAGAPVGPRTVADARSDDRLLTEAGPWTFGANTNTWPSDNTAVFNLFSDVGSWVLTVGNKAPKGVANAAGQRVYMYDPDDENGPIHNALISTYSESDSYGYIKGIRFAFNLSDTATVLAKAHFDANPPTSLVIGTGERVVPEPRIEVELPLDGDILTYDEAAEQWRPSGLRIDPDPTVWEGADSGSPLVINTSGLVAPASGGSIQQYHVGKVSYGASGFRDGDLPDNGNVNDSANWKRAWTKVSNGSDDTAETLPIPAWVKTVNWENGAVPASSDMFLQFNPNGVFMLAANAGTTLGRTYYNGGTAPAGSLHFYPWASRDGRSTGVYTLDDGEVFSVRAFFWVAYTSESAGTIWYEVNFYRSTASVGIAVTDGDVTSASFTSFLTASCGIYKSGVQNNLAGTGLDGYPNAPVGQGWNSYTYSRHSSSGATAISLEAAALGSLGDVNEVEPIDGQALIYDQATEKWGPGNPTVGGIGRVTVAVTTGTLAPSGGSEELTLTGVGRGGFIVQAQASAPCWVTFYSTPAARTADLSRDKSEDPAPGSGVLAEFVFADTNPVYCTPAAGYFNGESTPLQEVYLRITNTAGGSATVTFTAVMSRTEP